MLVLCFLCVTITTIVRSTGIGVWNNVTETRAKPFERMHVSEPSPLSLFHSFTISLLVILFLISFTLELPY